MRWTSNRKSRKGESTPATRYFENTWRVTEVRPTRKLSTGRSILLLGIAISLGLGGVAASVAITIRGNHDTVDNKISLGVGRALATSCTSDTAVKTDTLSEYVDSVNDFVLQQLNVSQVNPACENQIMNLVVHLSDNGGDINVTCLIPSSSNFDTNTVFEFATTSATTGSLSGDRSLWGCGAFNTGTTPVLMASISATAVQIS